MKKISLLLLFFTLSLCCYAQGLLNTGKNNEITPLYSGLSLSLFGFDNGLGVQKNLFGYPIMNTARTDNSTVLRSANFRINKLADYKNKSFFDTDIGPWICIIAGAAAMISAPIVGASEGKDSHSYVVPICLFSFGLGAVVGGFIWLFSN